MKLEHLIQAYNINKIPAMISNEYINEDERAGVITISKGISASYLLDDEDIVIAMKLFVNCLNRKDLKIISQVNHTIDTLKTIQQTIMLLSNIPQKECNMILEQLGLFDGTFKEGKQIQHLGYSFRIEVINGILCISIAEKFT